MKFKGGVYVCLNVSRICTSEIAKKSSQWFTIHSTGVEKKTKLKKLV